MGKHRWPTAGESWDPLLPPPSSTPADAPASPDVPAQPEQTGAGEEHDAAGVRVRRAGTADPRRLLAARDAAGPGPLDAPSAASAIGRGVHWRIARSAALVCLGVALAVGAALFLIRSSEPSAAAVSVQLDAPASAPAESTAAPSDPPGSGGEAPDDPASERSSSADPSEDTVAGGAGSRVVVYLTGAVVSPGVVTVPAGTRLFEIIEEAGGALPDADLEGINLAATPSDGQHIHLLAVGEEPRSGTVPQAPPVPGGQEDSGGRGGAAGGAGAASGGITGAIDINTAELADIESLPRVGPILGQRIIDWREEHGPFARTADIDAVPGIGPVMLEGILPLIVVR